MSGSAFGNLMWAPDDINYIEFNVFPNDPMFSSEKSKIHSRPSLLNSAWAKGGTGSCYIIDPYEKSYGHYYGGDIKVSEYEILHAMKTMNQGFIRSNYDISEFTTVMHINSDLMSK
jgi:hypothetical protein